MFCRYFCALVAAIGAVARWRGMQEETLPVGGALLLVSCSLMELQSPHFTYWKLQTHSELIYVYIYYSPNTEKHNICF